MNWSNVRLILAREIRDQLRDRRTMFVIVVLPMLLYPLLGMTFFQISQFVREVPTRVLVIGARDVPEEPPLFDGRRFAASLFSEPDKAHFLELEFLDDERPGDGTPGGDRWAEAQAAVDAGRVEAAIVFPPDFGGRIEQFRRAIQEGTEPVPLLQPKIAFSSASEKSQLAWARLKEVLRRWGRDVSQANLAAAGVPEWAAVTIEVEDTDLALATGYSGAAVWSKVLPVLLIIWALTGAFYPAVDLCAGEKERGTLETLLSSPAERSEIVLGKLVTIMLFSGVTAVLNLASIALTGSLMLSQWPGFGPPPPLSPLWLGLALLPAAALFSALCLALAALARSTKEGQYYLMPLLLVTMPLAILPATAGVELNLGSSLIPVTGLVLLLRAALEGNYWLVAQFAVPVLAVTLVACLAAIRWAVEQFNSESVLFRESERLDLGLWLRHVLRQRGPTPTAAAALCCGVLILLVHFFMNLVGTTPRDFADLAVTVLVTQLTVVLTPALLMTVFLSTSPRQTLLLRWPGAGPLAGAALLAVALHPAVHLLEAAVLRLYPFSEPVKKHVEVLGTMFAQAPWWQAVLVIALVPALCEELAFRGFILSGFRKFRSPWRAIVLSAVFFGLSHGFLQQSLIACVLGLLIGWLAVRTGSLLPGMLFHLTHNAAAVLIGRSARSMAEQWPGLEYVMRPTDEGGVAFSWPVVVAGAFAAVLLVAWLWRHSRPEPAGARPGEPMIEGWQVDV